MPIENLYKPSSEIATDSDPQTSDQISAKRATYNVISDTVAGLNTREKDNKFQAVFIGISILVAGAIGAILAALNAAWELPWYGGAMLGALAGLVIGFFASGIFLMVYRAVLHMQGKHD